MKKLVLFVVLVLTMGATTQAQKKTIFFKDALNTINMIEFGENRYIVVKGDLSKIPGNKKEMWEAMINSPNKVRVDQDYVVLRDHDFTKDIYRYTYEIWYDSDSQLMRYETIDKKLLKSVFNFSIIGVYLLVAVISMFLAVFFYSKDIWGNVLSKLVSITIFVFVIGLLNVLYNQEELDKIQIIVIGIIFSVIYLGRIIFASYISYIYNKRKKAKLKTS